MRVNIENCNNTGDPGAKEWVLGELVRNLKELRDRTDAGDMSALDEFFGLFVFNDDQDRTKVGAGTTATDGLHPSHEPDYAAAVALKHNAKAVGLDAAGGQSHTSDGLCHGAPSEKE